MATRGTWLQLCKLGLSTTNTHLLEGRSAQGQSCKVLPTAPSTIILCHAQADVARKQPRFIVSYQINVEQPRHDLAPGYTAVMRPQHCCGDQRQRQGMACCRGAAVIRIVLWPRADRASSEQ